LLEKITNFLFIYYVTSYTVQIFSKMFSEAQNCKCKVNILWVRRISTIHAFSVVF